MTKRFGRNQKRRLNDEITMLRAKLAGHWLTDDGTHPRLDAGKLLEVLNEIRAVIETLYERKK